MDSPSSSGLVVVGGVAFLVSFMVLSVISGMADGAMKPADITVSIKYSKDLRTGLCFGMIQTYTFGGRKNPSITTVPCTKEVESFFKVNSNVSI